MISSTLLIENSLSPCLISLVACWQKLFLLHVSINYAKVGFSNAVVLILHVISYL